MLTLEAFGSRIVIFGPSNSGKSTLAYALSQRLGVPAIHLDRFRHMPHTDWQVRPDAEFAALHDAAILGEDWVMEGNYSKLIPQRLARATGVIVLDGNHWFRFWRYLQRTLSPGARIGGLPGNKDSLKWEMVRWVLVTSRQHGGKYERMGAASGLPMTVCRTPRDLDELYRAWNLGRPGSGPVNASPVHSG
jgi:adenylate kinase family enzyme